MRVAKITRLLLCLALLALVIPAAALQPKAKIEQRIDVLLAKMTLAEKLGQLQQLDGEANGNFRPEHLELVRKGLLGSTLNVRGAQRTNQLQRIAIEESRLKIPLLFGFDVIHGYRTIFPIPLGEAATWDPVTVEKSCGHRRERSASGRSPLDLCADGGHCPRPTVGKNCGRFRRRSVPWIGYGARASGGISGQRLQRRG